MIGSLSMVYTLCPGKCPQIVPVTDDFYHRHNLGQYGTINPPSPAKQWWRRPKSKARHFGINEMRSGGGGGVERGGPYIPFIWSKIAATHRSHYLIYN